MQRVCRLEMLIPIIIMIIVILIIVKCFPQSPRRVGVGWRWSPDPWLGEGHSPPASHRSLGAAGPPSAQVPASRGGSTSFAAVCLCVCPCRWVLEGGVGTGNARVCG